MVKIKSHRKIKMILPWSNIWKELKKKYWQITPLLTQKWPIRMKSIVHRLSRNLRFLQFGKFQNWLPQYHSQILGETFLSPRNSQCSKKYVKRMPKGTKIEKIMKRAQKIIRWIIFKIGIIGRFLINMPCLLQNNNSFLKKLPIYYRKAKNLNNSNNFRNSDWAKSQGKRHMPPKPPKARWVRQVHRQAAVFHQPL